MGGCSCYYNVDLMEANSKRKVISVMKKSISDLENEIVDITDNLQKGSELKTSDLKEKTKTDLEKRAAYAKELIGSYRNIIKTLKIVYTVSTQLFIFRIFP